MSLRKILSPEKGKLLLDFLFSVVWMMAVLNLKVFGLQKAFSGFDLQDQIVIAAFNFFLFLVLYYPLSCGAIYIIRRFTHKETSNQKDLILAIVLVAVFNPVFLSLITMGLIRTNTEVMSRPCGLEMLGFTEYSAARESGIRTGETIVSVEGKAVDTTDALQNSLKDKKEGDMVSVGTDKGEYKIKVVLNPEKNFPMLGVNVKQKYCSR